MNNWKAISIHFLVLYHETLFSFLFCAWFKCWKAYAINCILSLQVLGVGGANLCNRDGRISIGILHRPQFHVHPSPYFLEYYIWWASNPLPRNSFYIWDSEACSLPSSKFKTIFINELVVSKTTKTWKSLIVLISVLVSCFFMNSSLCLLFNPSLLLFCRWI